MPCFYVVRLGLTKFVGFYFERFFLLDLLERSMAWGNPNPHLFSYTRKNCWMVTSVRKTLPITDT